MKQYLKQLKPWVIRNRLLLAKIGGGIVVVLLLVQIFYPGDRLVPFSSIDGVTLGAQTKSDAAKQLDDLSSKQSLRLSLGKFEESFDQPKPSDIGLRVSHADQVKAADYPWYLRIVPSSLLWYGLIQSDDAPKYTYDRAKAASYITTKLGQDCTIPAKDATLELKGETLNVVAAKAGGDCETAEAVKAIVAAKPRLDQPALVTVPVTVIAPAVGDDEAKRLADGLNKTSHGGVELKVADKTQTIPQKEVLSWLTFKPVDDGLGFEINPDTANAYLAKTATPIIAKPAGVTKVATADFTETSRQDGVTGQTLDLGATLAEITLVLDDSKDRAQAQVASLAPKVEYTRTYSKTSTGIAAQMKFYDDDNAGVFGVSFIELGGQGLSAQHNGDRQFVTASTYKLFVAFSTIKRVEADKMKWGDADINGGRDLSKCFDDMIVKSDNACAEALIKKIGAKDLNADIKSLGLASTAFRADNNVTTANDLTNYLTQLEKGTMPIKSENRDRLLGAMKRNVYRQGVPAGASGPVADKVGFLWGLLHDATVVYSPKGTYVLVVMTDGSTWGSIAELTRKIEALR
ncbi:MAG: serine hydrolase [Patescibacteria group bacterium]